MNAEPPEELAVLREKRELALACLWLALIIAVALPLTVFGDRGADLAQTNEDVEVHRKLLADMESLMSANQNALHDVQQALQNLKVATQR